MPDTSNPALRRLLLALVLFGLIGTTCELLLLRHYESVWMIPPFVAMAIAAGGAFVRIVRPSAATVWAARLSMLPLLVIGAAGVWLHYLGGLAFQADMDPTLSRWQLMWKVVHMQAPPALAPGALVQLALLGLVSTYGDPLIVKPASKLS